MDRNKLTQIDLLNQFWSDPSVSEEFNLLPSVAWEYAYWDAYSAYISNFQYELKLCRDLGIDDTNFLNKFEIEKLEENGEEE
jgi:hypothetical protein